VECIGNRVAVVPAALMTQLDEALRIHLSLSTLVRAAGALPVENRAMVESAPRIVIRQVRGDA